MEKPVSAAASAPAAAPAGAGPRSLVARLTRLNLLVLGLSLGITVALLSAASWWALSAREELAAQQNALLVANALAPMLAFEDQTAAHAELTAFARRPDLLELRLLDRQRAEFAVWRAEGQPASLVGQPAALPAEAQTLHVGSELRVWVPVRFRGETLGALLLRESLLSLQREMMRGLALAVLVTLLAIALASRALRSVQRRALAPIVELSALAERVARERDYGLRGRVRREDEVGSLTARFNEMLERIEVWQADLHQQLRQEQAAGQELQQLAHFDSLTQLPNRLFFQRALQGLVAQSLQPGRLAALMFIDLDNFKQVNDRHGHEAGDWVLREVAARMQSVLRSSDQLCRLGGDEFALLLSQLPDEGVAEQLAGRLIAAVRAPLYWQGQLLPVGATVGLAFCPSDAQDPAELLRRADEAMYDAKRAGKNCYRRADASAG